MRTSEDNGNTLLAATLFGKTRRRILSLLFGRSDEEFFVREIVRATGSAPGAVQRELELLLAASIIARRERGQHVFYRANHECPIFPELESIVVKTMGLVDALREALQPIRDRVDVAFVFGSMAKGQATSESDIDLFVVGGIAFADVVNCARTAEAKLARDINPVVQSTREFGKRAAAANHFLVSVLRQPKLFVFGGVVELGRLGAEGLVDQPLDEPPRDR